MAQLPFIKWNAKQKPFALNVYILRKDLPRTNAGTRLFLQDGMYFYKTNTEQEMFLTIAEVENNKELFRPITTTEFMYHCFQSNL